MYQWLNLLEKDIHVSVKVIHNLIMYIENVSRSYLDTSVGAAASGKSGSSSGSGKAMSPNCELQFDTDHSLYHGSNRGHLS